jgi:glycosyltransferase involved in cell wall biosynthesis
MRWFVVPDLDGPRTGGTIYNRSLIRALGAEGEACQTTTLSGLDRLIGRVGVGPTVWVDSLYLAEIPRIADRLAGRATIGLLVHYLPSLVASGGRWSDLAWSREELAAIRHASRFLVPSELMRKVVRSILALDRTDVETPILLVPPGCEARPMGDGRADDHAHPMRAIVVANLVPGKQVDTLLDCLASRLTDPDAFELTVLGDTRLDPSYAEACTRLARHPRLRERVRLHGSATAEQVIDHMGRSNLVISASRMESYGMALAEARTVGRPILATGGGNVRELVTQDSGGEVFPTLEHLADACVALARNPVEHQRRLRLARANALAPRPWGVAASEFLAQERSNERGGMA